MNTEIIYTAAHAHFPDTDPLGGGKAVADYLCRERPGWTVLSPRILAETAILRNDCARQRFMKAPLQPAPLHHMTEWQYARFCRQFERVVTSEIFHRDPTRCVVLTNDISEGPDFAALGSRGYRVVSIWHVDVVDYFTKFYLRSWLRPEMTARWSRIRWLPDVLKLVFHKQADCVRWSRRLVVPSAPMKETILQCYPDCPAEKIAVLPWGNISPLPDIPHDEESLVETSSPLFNRSENLSDAEFIIMTLSRLSPEKGIERLLRALRHLSALNYRVLICGAPAYMNGRRYERKLRRLAAGLPVEFPGHVTGERKAALLRRADLFISPSRHESYGLAIAEAQAAGCQIISHHHHGAAGQVVDCANPRALAAAIGDAIRRGRRPKHALIAHSDAADQLDALLQTVAAEPTGSTLAIRREHRYVNDSEVAHAD